VIYERRCCKCKHKFSHLCNMADRELDVDCPECGWQFTNSIMSATPTTFKFADSTAIKAKTKRQGGHNVLKGREAKYYADKHGMSPGREMRNDDE